MGILARIARAVERHPVAVIVSWAMIATGLFLLAFVGIGDAGNVFDRTKTGEPQVRGADSYILATTDEDTTPTNAGEPVVADFRVAAPGDPSLLAALESGLSALVAQPDVALVVTPFAGASLGALPGPAFLTTLIEGGFEPSALLRSDGSGFLIITILGPDAPLSSHQAVVDAYDQILEDLREVDAASEVHTYSFPLLLDHFSATMERDLVVGEAIALPLALLVMVLVFGGFLAASTPMAGAFASIAGGMAVVYGLTFPMRVEQSAQNVVTVLGIGLCIDYGLLIVSRYREEMVKARAAGAVDLRSESLVRAVETAGRTVFFSGVTVGIAVGSMLVFSPEVLRAFGGAALGVVVTAVAAALTLVPAIAYLYGERLIRPGALSKIPGIRTIFSYTSDVTRDEGVFSRLAGWVQRRPWLILGLSGGILLLFAAPATGLHMRNSQAEVLHPDDPYRLFLEDFGQGYPGVADPPVLLMAEASSDEFAAWAPTLLEVDGVSRLGSMTIREDLVFSGLFLDTPDAGGAEALDAVTEIRGLDPPFRLYVGGQAANQIDFVGAIGDGAPLALTIIALGTFLLLFLMTGSILVPVKTLIVNSLSLTASIGVIVWIFQDGHLEGLLDFQSPGGIETYVIVLILAFGFGLAMDYEMFLLSRIKEYVDRGFSNDEAVRLGLQRSARIITSAAAIVILVFLGFTAGHLIIIKEVGLGLAFAVLIDATVVRMLLVPATMTLLGDWNWWAPGPLRRLYGRLGLSHEAALPPRSS
jgi:putative drug exporter of the RND superfamily